MKLRLGIDVFVNEYYKKYKNYNLAILMNQASVNRELMHSHLLLLKKNFKLKKIFAPQHGLWYQTQDNMRTFDDFVDKRTGLIVHSLYSKTRKPTQKMLKQIDAVLIDIQDVGTRVYTFIWTMYYIMQACKKYNKKVIILDRPNPIGNKEEGNLLEEKYKSFIGLFPLRMRHGKTIGELALLFNKQINCDLEVVKMKNYNKNKYFDEYRLHWIGPSPNMPSIETAIVYPGTVLLEGTNISEGRGTCKPFEIIGAPFIDAYDLSEKLNNIELAGVKFIPMCFTPVFDKYKNQLCSGVQIIVENRKLYKPYLTGIMILKTIYDSYKKHFKFKKPPYEYEYKKMPVDIIAGTDKIRKFIKGKIGFSEILRII